MLNRNRFKIGILSPMGNGNLGDAAIQDAVLHNIKRYLPNAEVFGFSENPSDTEQRHHIRSFKIHRSDGQVYSSGESKGNRNPVIGNKNQGGKDSFGKRAIESLRRRISAIRDEIKFLHALFRILREIDLLIVSGGGQLGDFWGGCWGHPYSLFKWAVVCKIAGTDVAFVSVGADIVRSRISRFLIKRSLLLSTYRSFRDSDSKIFAEKIGVKRINGVYPDLAFSLPLNSTGGAPTKFKQSRSTVGVSPIAANAWTTKDDPIYGKYINELTSLILSLIKRGYKIELFPSQVRMDSPIIEDLQKEVLKRCLKIEYDYLSVNRLTEVSELIRQLSMVDIIIASRLHGVLLSALMKKPVLALSYNPKVNSLMKDIGLSEYCLNIDQFDCRAGLKIFGQIEALRETIEERLTEKVSSYRRSLDMQYRQVFDTGNFLRNREMRFKR